MSLQLTSNFNIPGLTKKIELAAFPKGNPYIQLRVSLGHIFDDETFDDLYPNVGQPSISPWRLALVTVLQHGENLSDRQAADAVRSRIDWKYLLSLDIDDSGFDFSVLSEFRSRLINSNAEERIFNKIIEHCKNLNLIKSRGNQRTDSTHVLASVKSLNKIEIIGESLRAALNEIACIEPEWLQKIAKPEWYDKYASRIENYRLPKNTLKKAEFIKSVGDDIHFLFEQINFHKMNQLLELKKIDALKLVVARFFKNDDDKKLVLKEKGDISKSENKIESPYDMDARFRTKRDTQWAGYAVHLTETCDDDSVNLLTDVYTTPADVHDSKATDIIQSNLVDKGIPPGKHFVNMGYVSIDHIVNAENKFGIDMICKLKMSARWQSKVEGAYTQKDFKIDWDNHMIQCPKGKYSSSWTENKSNRINVSFSTKDCKDCSVKSLCTQSKKRNLNILKKEYYDKHAEVAERMQTSDFKQEYKKRAGIEGTISQAVRRTDMRKSRYVGLAKTSLQESLKASAINLFRLADWFSGKTHAITRESRFYQLRPIT
jgi:transposase